MILGSSDAEQSLGSLFFKQNAIKIKEYTNSTEFFFFKPTSLGSWAIKKDIFRRSDMKLNFTSIYYFKAGEADFLAALVSAIYTCNVFLNPTVSPRVL